MKPEEYEEWKDDDRVGLCPFCSAPGWISGDPEWCEHYWGSSSFAGSPSFIPFEDNEPFSSFLLYLDEFDEWPELTKNSLLNKIDKDQRDLLQVGIDLGEIFFMEFIEADTLSVEIDEVIATATYFAYFTLDKERELLDLSKNVDSLVSVMRPNFT